MVVGPKIGIRPSPATMEPRAGAIEQHSANASRVFISRPSIPPDEAHSSSGRADYTVPSRCIRTDKPSMIQLNQKADRLCPISIARSVADSCIDGMAAGHCAPLHGTVLDDMRNGYVSLYARIPFRVEDPALLNTLTLTVDYDDGWWPI